MKNLLTGVSIIIFIFYSTSGRAFIHPSATKNLPARQLLVVVTDDWSTLHRLYGFEKHRNKWILKFSNPVVVGGKGLGIGDGLRPLSITGAPIKKEGDNKSPAGFFSIGTAFGYADKKDASWISNPYVKASDTLICVDDPSSVNYNRLVKNDTARNDYKSHEQMHLKADYYKWGLFVNHNAGKTVPGDGSCIFLHIWGNSNEGTAGCTAMAEADILTILHWIKADNYPMLVQMPLSLYKKLRTGYGLPKLAAENQGRRHIRR